MWVHCGQRKIAQRQSSLSQHILDSIVVSIPACHAGDRGSIPRRGDFFAHFLWNLAFPISSP